jgi:hypothetical protein
MLSEPIQVTLKVVSALERLGIAYLIGGASASTAQEVIRSTLDINLVMDLKPAQVPPLVAALEDEFHIDAKLILEAIRHTSSFYMIHLGTMCKVDVFILKQRPFDLNQMKRRVLQPLGSGSSERAYFSSAEDIVLAKLEWFRPGEEASERQWREILGLLKVERNRLDVSYMQKWAATLGVQDLLKKAMLAV